MQSSARESYLVTEVMTATPQKLQLMLIEAAIRFAQRARLKWRSQQYDQACEALVRAQQILGEMLGSLDHSAQPDLVGRVAAVYLFILRRLMEANMGRDEQKLDEALKILEMEQETWRLVCDKLAGSEAPDRDTVVDLQAHAASSPPPPPHLGRMLPGFAVGEDLPSSGLCLEG